MEKAFGEKIMAKFDEIADKYGMSWDDEDTRQCIMEGWVHVLNNGCNPVWNKFLDSHALDPDDTMEEKWEEFVNFEMNRKGTDDIREIYEDLEGTLTQYMAGNSNKCYEGEELNLFINECANEGKAIKHESSFDAEETAEDLLGCLENIDEDDSEVEFFKITNALTAPQKLKVRKELVDMGECLCDWIENSWQLGHETKVLKMWNMWEPSKTKGLNLLNNCTCYHANTKSIVSYYKK